MTITLDDVAISANGRPFFTHLSWTLADGERWAVLGPTGAGKTLLAQAIARRVLITHGTIRYRFDSSASEGRSFLHPGEVHTFSAETHRAFLERYASYYQARWQALEGEDNPTVAVYLMATRKPAGGDPGSKQPDIPPQAEPGRRADSTGSPSGERAGSDGDWDHDGITALLGLGPLLGRQVHQLSNGESRRVFLAGLLLRSPRLLILDDPFNGLDRAGRSALSTAVDSLLARGHPQVLFLASRPGDIPAGVSRVLLLQDGGVLAALPPADALSPLRLAALFRAGPPTAAGDPQPLAAPSDPGAPISPALQAAAARYASDLAPRATLLPPALIEMRGVTVSFAGGPVLDHLDWRVDQGQRWLISGPNGAGKSTLLSLVLGDNPQVYANPVSLFGRRRGSGDSIWAIKRAIGWVSPELHAFYARPSLDRPPLTALQVAESGFFDSVGLYRRPTPEQKALAAAWLDALGLASLSTRAFTALSNGQQRLSLLARALVKHPLLLILDEPCQALDLPHRRAITALVDALCAAAPLTLVYVTHDPDEAPACITHTLRLGGAMAAAREGATE